METEGSLPHSQMPATSPYSEPARSSPYPHIPLSEDLSYYYPPTTPDSPQWPLSLGFPTKTCTQATNTHSQYVTLAAFSLQQWLHYVPQCYVICTLPVSLRTESSTLRVPSLPAYHLLSFWKSNHFLLCSTCFAQRILIALATNSIISGE
jgi:hypothetical protein